MARKRKRKHFPGTLRRRGRKKRGCQCAMLIEKNWPTKGRERIVGMICGRLSRKYLRKSLFRPGLKVKFTACSAEDAKTIH